MPAGAGETLLLGIAVELDAQGVVRGVSLANQQFDQFDARADRVVRRSQQRNRDIQQGLQMAAGAATAMGASTLAMGEIARRGLLQPMISEAQNFEVEFAQLQFVTSETGAGLERLRDTAIRTGLETQFSPAEATEAMRRLRAAGLSTAEMYDALRPALDLATASAGQVELAEAATATAAALAKFRTQGESARSIIDTVAEATRQTNIQFHDFAIITNALRDFPIRFRATAAETFALAGAMRNVGQLSAQSGQAIAQLGYRLVRAQTMMDRFHRTGVGRSRVREMIEAAKELNVRLFDQEGRLRSVTDVIIDMTAPMNRNLTDQRRMTLASTLFGPAASAVVTALRKFRLENLRGGPAIRELIRRLEQSQGVSRQAAATFENTARGLRVFITGTIQTILILLGETLAPVLRVIMTAIRAVLNQFLELIQASPVLRSLIGGLIVAFVVLSFVVGTALLALGGLGFMLAWWTPVIMGGVAALTAVAAVLGILMVLAIQFGGVFWRLVLWLRGQPDSCTWPLLGTGAESGTSLWIGSLTSA